MTPQDAQRDRRAHRGQPPFVLERIDEALAGLRFGTVTVVVQDGVVVQVERTEKFRMRTG